MSNNSSEALYKINCPIHDNWHDIRGAMKDSATSRATLNGVVDKVRHLDSLPVIANEIKNSNKNNTYLLMFLAFVLVVNAVLVANISFKASGLGGSLEVSKEKQE